MLTLADGRVIDPKAIGQKKVEQERTKIERAPASFKPAPKDIKLEDLPAPPRTMSVIAAILGYKWLGIPEQDICVALSCTQEQLLSVMSTEAYTKSHQLAMEAFINGQKKTAKEVLQDASIDAAEEMVAIVRESRTEKHRLDAAKFVLNSTGVGETQNDDPLGGGLMIKIVREADADNIEVKIGI